MNWSKGLPSIGLEVVVVLLLSSMKIKWTRISLDNVGDGLGVRSRAGPDIMLLGNHNLSFELFWPSR